jgi:hypothetical protein
MSPADRRAVAGARSGARRQSDDSCRKRSSGEDRAARAFAGRSARHGARNANDTSPGISGDELRNERIES